MFEAGKKYVFSRTKFSDDMLKHTSLYQVEKYRQLVNTFDGHVFIGLDDQRRDLVKGEFTLTVWPEWCVSGEEDELI